MIIKIGQGPKEREPKSPMIASPAADNLKPLHLCLPDRRAGEGSPLSCRRCRRSIRDAWRFPKIPNSEAPPVHPERHVANSIATMRRHLIVALAITLARYPCCNAPRKTTGAYPFL